MAKYKRLGYALSVAVLLAGSGILAPAAFATGECSAGDLGTLQECLDTATTDIILTSTINVTSDASFDFSGITVETTGGGYDMFDVSNGASLTIGGGTVVKRGTGGSIFVVEGEGSLLTLNGGTFLVDAPNKDIYGVYLMSGGKIIVNAGATIDTTGSNGAAIGGNNTTGYMYATINGGTLRSKYQTVYMPQQVSLDIEEGSTLDGGIVARMGHINVRGGIITGKDGGDTIEDYYNLNNGYPWVADAIMVMGGTYINNNGDHDNALEINISGGRIESEDGHALAIYDMGKVAQVMNVNITGGTFSGKDGEIRVARVGSDEFIMNHATGYGAIENPINLDVAGGVFTTAPEEEELADGYEAFRTEDGYVVASPEELEKENLEYYDDNEDGFYELMPIKVDWGPDNWGWIEDCDGADGHVCGWVDFGEEMIADRLATLSMVVKDDLDGLTLDESKGGELIGAIDIDMLDRNNEKIEVKNNSLLVTIEIDEDTYNELSAYDKLYMVYFDEDGVEEERFEINLEAETYEEYTWYYLSFETTHLSTYAVVGVNEEEEATEMTETPETGTVTAAGASAISASLVTAVVVGLLVTMMSFAYLVRK